MGRNTSIHVSTFFSIMIFSLAAVSWARNALWNIDMHLWEDTVRKSYNKGGPHNGLGFAHLNAGNIDMAISEFQTAIRLKPSLTLAHSNLSVAYIYSGKLDMALQEAIIAVNLDSTKALYHFNLGTIYQYQRNLPKAEASFLDALKYDPEMPSVHINLGTLYYQTGKREMAISEFKKALAAEPGNELALNNLRFITDNKDM